MENELRELEGHGRLFGSVDQRRENQTPVSMKINLSSRTEVYRDRHQKSHHQNRSRKRGKLYVEPLPLEVAYHPLSQPLP